MTGEGIRIRGLQKRYGSTVALAGLDLQLLLVHSRQIDLGTIVQQNLDLDPLRPASVPPVPNRPGCPNPAEHQSDNGDHQFR